MSRVRATVQAGFTLVEMMIAASLLAVIMAFVANCVSFTTKAIDADEVTARAMESLQRSTLRVAQFLRPCSLLTYRVAAVAADVPTLASAVGEWIEPNEGEARSAVSFQAASGVVSMNAAMLTTTHVLRFELEPTETDNDVDDDGDGWVDEGDVVLERDGTSIVLASRIEQMTCSLTDRLLTLVMATAVRKPGGGMSRFSIQEVLFLRNN
jgi:prepilin-type N-terminal cleavage/methylation domain-containing protein